MGFMTFVIYFFCIFKREEADGGKTAAGKGSRPGGCRVAFPLVAVLLMLGLSQRYENR